MNAGKSRPDDFRKILERISHRHDPRRVFDAFTRLAACALAVQTREAEYLEEARRWEKPELDRIRGSARRARAGNGSACL